MEDVVEATIAAGALDGEHIEGLLDHADDRAVAAGVLAVSAGVGLGDIHALGTEADALFDVEDGLGKCSGFLFAGAKDVVSKPLGRLGADTRQPVEGLHQALNRLRGRRAFGHGAG